MKKIYKLEPTYNILDLIYDSDLHFFGMLSVIISLTAVFIVDMIAEALVEHTILTTIMLIFVGMSICGCIIDEKEKAEK